MYQRRITGRKIEHREGSPRRRHLGDEPDCRPKTTENIHDRIQRIGETIADLKTKLCTEKEMLRREKYGTGSMFVLPSTYNQEALVAARAASRAASTSAYEVGHAPHQHYRQQAECAPGPPYYEEQGGGWWGRGAAHEDFASELYLSPSEREPLSRQQRAHEPASQQLPLKRPKNCGRNPRPPPAHVDNFRHHAAPDLRMDDRFYG